MEFDPGSGARGPSLAQEQHRTTIPTKPRSLAEIEAPFTGNGHFAGLQLEHAGLVETRTFFLLRFQESGNAQQFGKDWANMMRAIYTPTIKAALDPKRERARAVIEHALARCAVGSLRTRSGTNTSSASLC